ncbi:MAG: glutamate mutase L [Anaerolineaceae bacterium]
MSPANQEALSVLALDIGTVYTRALLFEVVQETYHFIASGVTPSECDQPINDITVGVLDAIDQLQIMTGRILLNQQNSLITPSQAGGEGVDRIYITYSIGRQLNVATYGLMSDLSLQSINKLAATIKAKVVESISLNDPRTIHQQIDDTLKAKPDLILFGGGTDRGASRSVKKMANLILSILQLLPRNERPPVVFSGNQSLVKAVDDILSGHTQFISTANVRPEMENEELDQASEDLAKVITNLHSTENTSLKHFASVCHDSPCPAATAIGRITRFLSKVGDPEKGVLSIDLGASSTITASARAGKLNLNVFPFGSGQGFAQFLQTTPFSEISQWFPTGTNFEDAQDILWQKTLFPASIPSTYEALSVEQSAYRQLLRLLMHELAARDSLLDSGYETILCSGAALTQAANPRQLLLMLLDGLQPKGLTTIILDSHSILSTLGAIARTLPILPVQVLESSAFANLATVVSVQSTLRVGSQVVRAHLLYDNGKTREIDVKQGAITMLPLKTGESAVLELDLSRNTQLESADLVETKFKVNGGLCGVVIDARGRPLKLPVSAAVRGELLGRWDSMLATK